MALVTGGSGHTCFLTPEEEETAERGSHASPLRCRRPRAPRPEPLGSGYTGLTGADGGLHGNVPGPFATRLCGHPHPGERVK